MQSTNQIQKFNGPAYPWRLVRSYVQFSANSSYLTTPKRGLNLVLVVQPTKNKTSIGSPFLEAEL